MTNEANMPELRFPGFNGKWEIKKLKDIGDIITGKTPSTSNPKFYNGNYPFVSPLDIQNHRFIKKTNKTLSEKGFYSGRIIRKGASLFVCIGSTIGKIGQAGADVITNQQINSLIPYERYDDNFIYSNLLKSSSKIKQLAATQALPIINKETFGSYFINLPQLDEQIKIGNFFNKLDRQIELEEQKLAKLEEQKKGYMQKLFSQELRFKDDSGCDYPNWKYNYLGNYMISHDEKTTENNQYPVLTSSREGLFLQKDYFTRDVASKDNTGYNVVPYGYFTYRHMSDDLVFKFNINYIVQKGIVSTLYPVFKTTSDLDNYFLKEILNNGNEFKKYALMQKQGGSRTYMYFSKLKQLKLHIPVLKEQEKISVLLKKLDSLIEKQSYKVELLKERKKGFLQKMFV